MGCVFLERDGWPGILQISFMEREETKTPPAEAAKILLEDTLEERDIPFPREAIKVEDRGDMGIASVDYLFKEGEAPDHWRIWFLVDKTRAIMAAYISDPEHDNPSLAEVTSIIADIEFIPEVRD